jgi:anion-transporting  ArsA/GET3 family ATPase
LASVITLQVDISDGSVASRGLVRACISQAQSRILCGLPIAAAVFSTAVPGLFERRLIFVTGKGGVGKSTVSTALGVLAARRGLRTIVAELASQDRIRQSYGEGGDTFEEVALGERLFTISVDPQRAMEEYLKVKTGPVGQALGSSRLFGAFAMATPGMRELLSVGKVWELSQDRRRTEDAAPYDLVIVDSPAAGHGVGILRTPRTFAEIARVGPIAHQGRTIAATIADQSFTAVVAVTTAEEMPVNETLWLRDALAAESLPLHAVIVNARYPQRFSRADARKLAAARQRASTPVARAALAAAVSEQARGAAQSAELARLADGLGQPLVELPYLFTEDIGPDELERLADALERGLCESDVAGGQLR